MASIKSVRELRDIELANEVYFTDRTDYINYPRGSGGEEVDKTDEQKYTHKKRRIDLQLEAFSPNQPLALIKHTFTHQRRSDH